MKTAVLLIIRLKMLWKKESVEQRHHQAGKCSTQSARVIKSELPGPAHDSFSLDDVM